MDNTELEKINRFTRRPLSAEEVYTFSVILCDNEIDRDCERFSDSALEKICSLFIGKTGISDHDARASNQSARIYDTELVTDSSRTTKNGEPYRYVRAMVYMVKTDDNKGLIAEIDGGIKKEVSISCSASQRSCSICGCDRNTDSCAHVKGREYGGKVCHTVLGGITDGYEWSFVAVPAQVNAGVTKTFRSGENVFSEAVNSDVEAARAEILRDIRRLAFISGGTAAAGAVCDAAGRMNVRQLIELKKSYERRITEKGVCVQLSPENKQEDSTDGFTLR
ncbi:MAG: hypothetical protein PUB66_07995 [Oscillospiraceae bacterium]|nr:hypothetical protein [Oscillospiraceae bacterium]